MKRFLQKANDFIKAYPLVAIGIVATFFGALWWFFGRRSAASVSLNKSNLRLELPAYVAKADAIESSFGLNDDEETIFKQLEGLNKDELRAVFNAYGERELFFTNDITAPYGYKNLISALKAKLNDDEQKRMALIWKDTGLWD